MASHGRAAGFLLVLSGCASLQLEPIPPAPIDAAPQLPPPVRTAPPSPMATSSAPQRPAAAAIFRGTGVFTAPPTAGTGTARLSADGEISLNFANADVREVARAVLGDALHLNYTVDPRLQTTVTVETTRPLPPQAVLPALESILRASGVAMVVNDGVYRLVPLEEAARDGAGIGDRPGYGIQVLPLKFITAAEMAKILEPFLPPGAVMQTDARRNLLIVSGTPQDRANFADLANTFDVDMLKGMSVGIFPLRVGSPRGVASELGKILNDGGDGPLGGRLRIVPIERLNAIMVMSPQPAYLDQARVWIERLDYGNDETTPQLYQYFVQNSRATDLAKVLGQLFGGSTAKAATPQTAPGTTTVQLGQPFPGAASSSAATTSATTSRPPPAASPLASTSAGASPTAGTGTNPPMDNDGDTVIGGPGLDLPQVRIVADDKNNALIILAKSRDYRMVENTIRKLDIAALQVVIEATIAEVTLNDQLQFGLQYFFRAGSSSASLTSTALGTVSAAFPGFNYVLSGSKASVVLNALTSITHVNVLSSPELMVLDHQSAVLQVGDQVPIPVQQSQSTVNSDAPLVNSIDYRDTGVILRVSPRVSSSGLVTLDISQEVSDVTTTTTSTLDAPTIQQRRIQSTVSVQDGETLALGGLIKDSKTRIRSGIPVLADIPGIGFLFRNTSDTNARTELLVLLSPHVVRNVQDSRNVTQELRQRMQGLTQLGPVAR